MILDSDRLITSLPFYNHLQKQEIRKTRANGYWDLKVDTWALKPFQIKTGMACGNVTIADLVDGDGNVIDLLDNSTYDIDASITIKNDGTNHWIIFDGFLAQELPIGHYYIELGDCFHTWYSEWFYTCRICKDPSKMYNNTKKMEYSTHERGMCDIDRNGGKAIITHFSTSPELFYYNGKTYGCWMQKAGGSYNAESMVYAVNHNNCSISDSYGVGYELVGAEDHHPHPSILVADDGHIVVAHEHQRAIVGDHNDEIIIKRSDEVEDETRWVNANAGNVNYYTSVGNSSTERLAYQHLYKTDDSTIYLIAREYGGSTGADQAIRIYNSTDHAITWSSGDTITDFTGESGANWLYPSQTCKGEGDFIDLVIFNLDYSTGVYKGVYYLKSNDGITWTDVNGGGSKNIITGGFLTKAELDANDFKVASDWAYRPSCTDENGNPFLLLVSKTPSYKIGLAEYSGGAWDVHEPGIDYSHNGMATIVYRGAGVLDVYMKYSESSGKNSIRHYRIDPDDYSDWNLLETVYTSNNTDDWLTFIYGSYTFNHNDIDLNVLTGMLATELDDALNSFSGHSDLFLQFDSNCTPCNGITAIKWWNDTDMEDIIYQYGFKNYLYLDKDIVNHEWNTEKEGKPRDGHFFVTKVISKKAHSIVLLAPEYVADMCELIPSHSDVYIVDVLGDEHEVKEINVETTKFNEGLFRISINFYVNPTYSSNCNANKTLT